MTFTERDREFMTQALNCARQAQEHHEVPVGAVIVHNNQVIASAHNQSIRDHDPTSHAEVLAIRRACQHQQNYRLPSCTLYVTLEPCLMCVGAIVHARIQRLVFAASDPKTGACKTATHALSLPMHNHHVECASGLLASESADLLKAFFRARR